MEKLEDNEVELTTAIGDMGVNCGTEIIDDGDDD